MKVLITGGNGFLGSALAYKCLNKNYNVYLLLRKNSNTNRIKNNIENFKIFRYYNDIDIDNFITSIKPDVIIHTACCYGRKSESPLEIFDTNFRYGLTIINALNKLNKEVIFLNSATSLPPNLNYYSLSKHQFSELVKYSSEITSSKIKFFDIVLQHIYGPNDDKSKFITYVINACLSNEKKLQLTAGEQLRDFVYIDDVVDAYLFIINNLKDVNTYDKIEVGSGHAISIKELVLKIHEIAKSTTYLDFEALPYRKDEIMFSKADLGYLNSLGWSPKFDIFSGIEKTIKMEK